MVSVLDACTEACGWIAAIVAVFFWGTYGVPIKSNVNVDVNFFVMQSYKCIVCFVTSFLVVLLGEEVKFSHWGIVSGLFWVPGASCGIYAIRNAGMATAVGTWSSIQVASSFVFGVIIFQEKVKDTKQTVIAFLILIVGLIGMSRYADPLAGGNPTEYTAVSTSEDVPPFAERKPKKSNTTKGRKQLNRNGSLTTSTIPRREDSLTSSPKQLQQQQFHASDAINAVSPMEIEEGIVVPQLEDANKAHPRELVVLFGGRLVLTKRQMGVLAAIVNGAWGGLNLIPLHYAQRDQGMSGASYLISYASGSMLVCILIWIGLFVYQLSVNRFSVEDAVDALPRWHVRELGVPGILAGLFYSVGNFGSILAVAYLGQGVGFSFCQGNLLISGLWAVFYFREITGRDAILKWFASACVTIGGIIWLSFQHQGGGDIHL
jgi:glucose uptake protein GlcU